MLKKDQNSEKNYKNNYKIYLFPCNSLGEVAFTQNKKKTQKKNDSFKTLYPMQICYIPMLHA